MKKSTAYNLAQIAVIQSPHIAPETKPEILRVLMADEELERYIEEQNETVVEE